MENSHVQLAGSAHNVRIWGIRLLGVNAHNAHKLLASVILLVSLYLLSKALRAIFRITREHSKQKVAFWARQGISLVTFVIGGLGLISIWFDNPARLATGAGLIGAGLAFALQKVVTSFAGYFVIIRGKTFNVGDRITMGGVRGDVIALNFIQTVIMEMGEPPSVQASDPGMWVESRQYSGRIVTVSNSKIFDDPIYNYTRKFPYIWEEMHIPVSYKADRHKAEQILLDAAAQETVQISEMADSSLRILEERFFIKPSDVQPRVFMRLTDNWVELTVRFLCKDHDIRGLKNRMSRKIIDNLDAAGIGIASSTYDIVGFPPVRVETMAPAPAIPSLREERRT